MRRHQPALREGIAADYALGTLGGPARRRVARMMAEDPRLRGEVEFWESQLAPLLEAVVEHTPPARVWHQIQHTVGHAAAPRPRPWLERIALWRAATAVAFACALLLAVVLGSTLSRPPQVHYVAVVLDSESRGAWLVSLDPDGISRASAVLTQQLEADRAFELWLLPATGHPRSLGLLAAEGPSDLDDLTSLVPLLRDARGLAVSIEPRGGSPTGAPTGPVRYQGTLRSL